MFQMLFTKGDSCLQNLGKHQLAFDLSFEVSYLILSASLGSPDMVGLVGLTVDSKALFVVVKCYSVVFVKSSLITSS